MLVMSSEWHLETQSDVTSVVKLSMSAFEKLSRLDAIVKSRDALPARWMARANVFKLEHLILSGLATSSCRLRAILDQTDEVDIAVKYQALHT